MLLVFQESKRPFYLSVMSYHLRNALMKEIFFVNEVVEPNLQGFCWVCAHRLASQDPRLSLLSVGNSPFSR